MLTVPHVVKSILHEVLGGVVCVSPGQKAWKRKGKEPGDVTEKEDQSPVEQKCQQAVAV